jgi:hypothetical protein
MFTPESLDFLHHRLLQHVRVLTPATMTTLLTLTTSQATYLVTDIIPIPAQDEPITSFL